MMSVLKKVICFTSILVLVFVQTGCGNQAQDELSSEKSGSKANIEKISGGTTADIYTTENGPSVSENEKMRIGYSMASGVGPWYEALHTSIVEAAEQSHIELDVYDAGSSFDTAFADIRKMISEDYDAIGILPISIDEYNEVLAEANQAGIQVIMIDRPASDESLYDALITSDFYQQGVLAAQWLIASNGKINQSSETESVDIVVLHGGLDNGFDQSDKRYKGFVETLSTSDDFVIIESVDGGYYAEQARNVMAELLTRSESIDVVYACNDSMAAGAIAAIEEAGIKPGEDIIVIGVDAAPESIELIKSGKMNCTIEHEPRVGDMFIEYVIKSVSGEQVKREWYPDEEAIDISNLESADFWSKQSS